VKRLCEAVGLSIQRLFRPEFAGVTVDGLRPGQYRPLTAAEVRAMREAVGLATAPAAAPPRPGDGAAPRSLPRAARRHGHGPPAPPERSGDRKPPPRGRGQR
jgi:23S rRNA pseudouridine2605 synthase